MPLEIHIQGFEIASLEARMAAMMRPTYSAILNHAQDGEPAIVFVPSRWHALRAALELLTFAAADGQPKRFLQVGLAPSDQPGAGLLCLCCMWAALQLLASTAAAGQLLGSPQASCRCARHLWWPFWSGWSPVPLLW